MEGAVENGKIKFSHDHHEKNQEITTRENKFNSRHKDTEFNFLNDYSHNISFTCSNVNHVNLSASSVRGYASFGRSESNDLRHQP